jgi:hypothetical protein
VINYTPQLRVNFGNTPNIEVMYRQSDGTYIKAEVQIALKGVVTDEIVINHGGIQTGHIKLSA